jgi:hypothetical protein
VLQNQGNPIESRPSGPDLREVHEGRQYPMVRHAGRYLLVQPARGLLLFVEALVRGLADRQGRPAPAISHYVDAEMRQLAWYSAEGEAVEAAPPAPPAEDPPSLS